MHTHIHTYTVSITYVHKFWRREYLINVVDIIYIIHVYLSIYMYIIHAHTCIHVYMTRKVLHREYLVHILHIYIYVFSLSIYIYICILSLYLYIYVCVCIHVYMYMYVHIYICTCHEYPTNRTFQETAIHFLYTTN